MEPEQEFLQFMSEAVSAPKRSLKTMKEYDPGNKQEHGHSDEHKQERKILCEKSP